MERRAFLKFICAGVGAATALAASSARSHALSKLAPVEPMVQTPSPILEPAVATDADMEQAKVEQAHWRRRYWRRHRRWHRRHWRRWHRRYWRRRYYYW